jgi:hypothetical protein
MLLGGYFSWNKARGMPDFPLQQEFVLAVSLCLFLCVLAVHSTALYLRLPKAQRWHNSCLEANAAR